MELQNKINRKRPKARKSVQSHQIKFDAEREDNNIEYKRHLCISSDFKKVSQLASQMNRRINNGIELHNKAEAFYYIGVNDDGTVANITEEDLKDSINTLKNIVSECNCLIKEITTREIYNFGEIIFISIIHIIKIRNCSSDTRIMLLGSEQVGKTTTLNSIIANTPDDGNGLGRKNVLTLKREIIKGSTTTIKLENIYFRCGVRIYNSDDCYIPIKDIVMSSDKIVTLIDTPGKKKYLKYTIRSILSHKPDHNYIIYCSDNNLDNQNIETTIQFIKISLFLQIPFTIIVTKGSIVPQIFNSYNIIYINNLTLEGINQLNDHIYNVPKSLVPNKIFENSTEFIINDTINSVDFGTIISGIVLNGSISNGDKLLIGPNKNEFIETEIKTIHRKQMPTNTISTNDDASIVIDNTNITFKITKNMLIFSPNLIAAFRSKFYMILSEIPDFKVEKNMKIMMFMSNTYEKIYVIKEYIINNSVYMYECKISKDKKKIIHEGEKILLRYKDNIICATITLTK